MVISGCLKIQVDSSPPFIAHFRNYDFTSRVSSDDLALYALLQSCFYSEVDWVGSIPELSYSGVEGQKIIGTTYTSTNSVRHSEESTSLVCFKPLGLREFLANSLITNGDYIEDILSSTNEELQTLLDSIGMGVFKVINSPITVKVYPCTQSELENLSQTHPSSMDYRDFFPVLKSRLARLEESLETDEYTVARYVKSGDYVRFRSNCGIVKPERCTPLDLEILFKNEVGEIPQGTVYAKYRVNGSEWVYYTDTSNLNELYSPVYKFLTGITHKGDMVITDYGNGGIAPFCLYFNYSGIVSGRKDFSFVPPPFDSIMQYGVEDMRSWTIDFEVQDKSPNDLVYLAFGGDASVKSCVTALWQGT